MSENNFFFFLLFYKKNFSFLTGQDIEVSEALKGPTSAYKYIYVYF